MKASKIPIALLPPPTQAMIACGDLPSRLASDDRLEFADHQRIRMRAKRGAEEVMRVMRARDPVAHRFVDRVLQRAGA